jgi:hypothetical protein
MTNRSGLTLNRGKKALLAVAGALAITGPVVVGALIGFGQLPEIHAQSPLALPAAVSVAAPSVIAQASPAAPVASVQDPSPAITRFQDRRLIVMFFDLTAATADQQARAKLNASLYIQNQTRPEDLVSVMSVVSGSVQVVQDFTANAAELTPAIQNIKGDPAATATTDAKLAMIESAASMVRAFPQKKVLLYYSTASVPVGGDNQAALKHAIDAAKEANLAILPVDIGTTSSPAGPGRAMAAPAPPPDVSAEEYARRVAYAQSTFGAKGLMASSYIRYGAPDQMEDRGTSQVWRYKYLDDYRSGAAFEFSKASFLGVHILYPQPAATFEGNGGSVAQLAPLVGGLRGGADASSIKGFPNQHPTIQVYLTAPGMAPAPDRRFVPVLIPIDALSGTVDIVSQVRTRTDNQEPGQIMANLADTVHAPSGTYQTAFTLRPGAYVCKVLVREASTGRMFGEAINFDVK